MHSAELADGEIHAPPASLAPAVSQRGNGLRKASAFDEQQY
jgi:hypothetical protein